MSVETVFTPPVKLRRYRVPSVQGEGWGVFVIGSDGYFSCVTDWGNYSYWWSNAGMEFREFLLREFYPDYFADKFRVERVIDGEATEKEIKKHILDRRREGLLEKEEAAEEWRLINEHSLLGDESTGTFTHWAYQTSLEDAWEFRRTTLPGMIRGFAEKIFPRFQALLRAELEAETQPIAEVAHVG